MKPIRFAIVGAGMISELHAKVISEMGDAELVGFYSHDLNRAKGLTDQYGGTPTTDFEELIARENVDAVSVCTASGEHA